MGIQINGTTDTISAVDGTLDINQHTTFGGNVSVGGTLTYEDVRNVDSIGIITARSDIHIGDKIVHIGDTNTAIRFPTADTITAETGGDERLRIASDGKVYFGDFASVGSKAYIFKETSGDYKFNIFASSSTSANRIITFNSRSDVEALRIDASGRIGINNSAPLYPMHFKNAMGSSPSWIHMEVTGSNTTGGGGGIAFDTSASNSASNNGLFLATISGERSASANGSNTLVFKTSKANTNGDGSIDSGPKTQMVITEDGKIGIGTNTPATNLHVKGTGTDILKITSTDAGAQGTNLIMHHASASPADNDVISLIQFNGLDDSSNSTTYSSIRAVATDVSNNSEQGALTFFTRNGSTFGERLRITSTGSMLLAGATTATAHADADDLVLNERAGGNVGMTFKNAGTGYGVIYFADSGAQHSGRIQYDHSNDTLDLFAGGGERLNINSNGAFGLSGANYGSSGQVLTSQGSGAAAQWASAGGGWTTGTENTNVNSTSSVSQTGLSNPDKIEIVCHRLRNSGANGVHYVQIGTSGGYTGTYNDIARYNSTAGSNVTTRGHDQSQWVAWHYDFDGTSNEASGTITITKVIAGTYLIESSCIMDSASNNTQYHIHNAGRVTFSGTLDRVKIYTSSGTNFTNGMCVFRYM